MGALGKVLTAGASIASSALGMIGQRKRERRAMQNQKDLMNLQQQNQMELNKQGQQLQLDTWDKTNYKAQMKMMKEAGLNPALMYGMGGGGGTTAGSQGGGSAQGGSAPAPQPMNIGNIVEAIKAGMEMALIKSQIPKTETETKAVAASIPKTEAETKNIEAQTTGREIENEILKETKEDAINIIKKDSGIKNNQSLQTEIETIFNYYLSGGEGTLIRKNGSQAYATESAVKESDRYKQYKAGKEKLQAEAQLEQAEVELTQKLRDYGANSTTVNAIISLLRIALGK